jgi:hypothetical protein
MTTRVVRDGWKWALLVLLAGCGGPPTQAQNKDEEQIRQVFESFQKAIKDRDGDKLWSLLDPDSQADADREAQKVREAYDKAEADDKTKQETAFGLSAAELKDLKGAGFLKSKRFCGKYHEVPDSKLDKVTFQGDNGATVHYVEPDTDKEHFDLVRKSGQWKLVVRMPKAN